MKRFIPSTTIPPALQDCADDSDRNAAPLPVDAAVHAAPAAASVAAGIEEKPPALRIGADAQAIQLSGNQQIRRRFEDRIQQ
jgi:hypothetical protein